MIGKDQWRGGGRQCAISRKCLRTESKPNDDENDNKWFESDSIFRVHLEDMCNKDSAEDVKA